ncbi:hypothetical protein V496_07246 [Pseudogymnoascus sp. VKM F-4515 (FW-2607)]|nr:hypothetical protein V496_07246 [Pseudogymnoascus sp. VKM F-4515 (FW-2607)]
MRRRFFLFGWSLAPRTANAPCRNHFFMCKSMQLDTKTDRSVLYNRIAQRESRQRRKQKLTELEASQSITFAEQRTSFSKSQLYDPNWCFLNNIALPPVVPLTEHHTPSIVPFAPSILELASDGLIWDTLGRPNKLPGAMPSPSNMHGLQYPMEHPAGLGGSRFDLEGDRLQHDSVEFFVFPGHEYDDGTNNDNTAA